MEGDCVWNEHDDCDFLKKNVEKKKKKKKKKVRHATIVVEPAALDCQSFEVLDRIYLHNTLMSIDSMDYHVNEIDNSV